MREQTTREVHGILKIDPHSGLLGPPSVFTEACTGSSAERNDRPSDRSASKLRDRNNV